MYVSTMDAIKHNEPKCEKSRTRDLEDELLDIYADVKRMEDKIAETITHAHANAINTTHDEQD